MPDHDDQTHFPAVKTVRRGEINVTMKRPEAPDWGGEETDLGTHIYYSAWDSEDGSLRLWVGPYEGGLHKGWAVSVSADDVEVVMKCTADEAVEWARLVAAAVYESRAEAVDSFPEDWTAGTRRTAFDLGYNIVNQLGDQWQVPVDVRQASIDRCWAFVTNLLEEFVAGQGKSSSDQGLREALQALAADWRSQPADPDSTGMTVMRHCGAQIARALDEHPAEPATNCRCLQDESGIEVKPGCPEHDPRRASVQVEITDEAVEAAARIEFGIGWEQQTAALQGRCRQFARAALVAAAPLLGPQPMLDRGEVHQAIANVWPTQGDSMETAGVVQAVMELARPMPTAEQIHQALAGKPIVRSADKPSDWRGGLSPSEIDDVATIVLALLNGAGS